MYMKKCKEEDLILYLYKESSPELTEFIEEALTHDLELQDRLRVLRRTIRQLDKLKTQSPPPRLIREILKHARK